MSDAQLPSPTSIPHLIATHILRTSSASTSMAVQDLAAIIGEVTIRTQILGASFLSVTVIDPDWEFQTSGILDVTPEGLLDTVDVNFPEGSDKWWRLCAISGTGDRTTPNVTMVFEDRIVAYLRDHWGPKTIAPGTQTRAQFIKQLVSEVKATPIRLVCPSINEVQPVASKATTNLGQSTVSTAIDQQNASIKANKSRGVGVGAKVTVKGQAMSKAQINEASTLIGVANALKAGPIATEALIFAAIAESGLGGQSGAFTPNSAGYYGVLQGSAKTWPDPHDTVGMATAFLRGGKGFQSGGAIALSRTVTDPIQIAVRVEVPSIWPNNAYAGEAGFSNFLPEAKAIIAAAGGTVLGSQGLLTTSTTGVSDVSQLTRGTADNPDETSWDAIARLAREVSWFAFSNGSYLYYMDGYDLSAQKPTAYIELIEKQGSTPTNGRRWQLTDSVTGAKTLDVLVSPSPTYNVDNALALDTPIPTPTGWTTMGEIREGDLIFGSNGRPTPVIGVAPVQVGRECFCVRFNDGAEIVADGEHLWETCTHEKAGDRAVGGRTAVRTTTAIRETLRATDSSYSYSHRVKNAAPLDLPDADLPIDPYVFGYWLGDGRSADPMISTSAADVGSIEAQVRRAGYGCLARTYRASPTGFSSSPTQTMLSVYLGERRGSRHADNMKRRLRNLDVLGNKHIPALYLRASAAQRLALLQGLMDSDGTIGDDCQLALASERLATDALEIIRSLGFRVACHKNAGRGNSKPLHRLGFATRDHVNVFRLPRKADAYARRLAEKSIRGCADRRSIVAVEPVASAPVRCLAVDTADHLYLAGEAMIPTHNTALIYRSTHTVKGKIQRKSRVAKPSTPSEIQISLICPIDYLHAGDVIVFQGCGPIIGRWVVTDATRNCLADLFTQVTLEPPIAPLPEPQATEAGAKLTGTVLGGSSVGGFTFPLPVGSAVGKANWTQDQGVDIAAPGNTPLFAVATGTVVGHGITGFGPSAPILKLAKAIQGQRYVYYGHAGPAGLAPVGAKLDAGEQIASVGPGIVGISTGPHLEIGFCDANGTPAPGTSGLMLSLLTKSFAG